MYYMPTSTNDHVSAPSRAAGLVTVQLGPELKRAWTQWCMDRDLVPGKVLRALVERELSPTPDGSTHRASEARRISMSTHPDHGPKIGREIQFTPSENAAVEAIAQAQGFSFQQWVVAVVRAALTDAPGFGQTELEALTQSNAHMAQIAIDLAALRRGTVEGTHKGEGDAALVEALARIDGYIRRHVEQVSAAMAQGARRWQLNL